MRHLQSYRIGVTAIVVCAFVAALTLAERPAQAAPRLTPAQQAKADAALLRLWTRSEQVSGGIAYDETRAAKVTVGRIERELRKGANVNAKTAEGETALMYASSGSTVDCVRLLIAKGATVNATNRDGTSVLEYAASSGRLPAVKYLVARGANVNWRDHNWGFPLICAVYSGNAMCVKFLIQKGAHVNDKMSDGTTPLYEAHDHPDIVAILKAAGAK